MISAVLWKNGNNREKMKVDKDKFDALLGKLMQTPPQPAKSIETQGKAGKIIPASPQTAPRKA
jgi:hypothetical protein